MRGVLLLVLGAVITCTGRAVESTVVFSSVNAALAHIRNHSAAICFADGPRLRPSWSGRLTDHTERVNATLSLDAQDAIRDSIYIGTFPATTLWIAQAVRACRWRVTASATTEQLWPYIRTGAVNISWSNHVHDLTRTLHLWYVDNAFTWYQEENTNGATNWYGTDFGMYETLDTKFSFAIDRGLIDRRRRFSSEGPGFIVYDALEYASMVFTMSSGALAQHNLTLHAVGIYDQTLDGASASSVVRKEGVAVGVKFPTRAETDPAMQAVIDMYAQDGRDVSVMLLLPSLEGRNSLPLQMELLNTEDGSRVVFHTRLKVLGQSEFGWWNASCVYTSRLLQTVVIIAIILMTFLSCWLLLNQTQLGRLCVKRCHPDETEDRTDTAELGVETTEETSEFFKEDDDEPDNRQLVIMGVDEDDGDDRTQQRNGQKRE